MLHGSSKSLKNRKVPIEWNNTGLSWCAQSHAELNFCQPVASTPNNFATVEPGTHFLLEKAPVGDGIWEPTHFSMKSQAKVLFFFNHRNQENDVYFGYRRANEAESAQVSPGTLHRR